MLLLSWLSSVPYSLSNSRADPASPKPSQAGGAQAQRSCGRSGSPKVPLRRLSAAGRLPGAAGYEVKEWTKATAQLLQWPSAMLICDGNAPRGHARVSKPHAFLAICNTMYTRMIPSSHTGTAHVRTAHEAISSPPPLTTKWLASYMRATAALHPRSTGVDVLTEEWCMAVKIIHAEIKLQAIWISEIS